MSARNLDAFPQMKVRGKHRKADRTVLDRSGAVISRTWVPKPTELGPVKLSRRVRVQITLCPGIEAGCRHCLDQGRGFDDWDSEEDSIYDDY